MRSRPLTALLIALPLLIAATAITYTKQSPSSGSVLYATRCAACHGTRTEPGRAPSLFSSERVRNGDDEGVAQIVGRGVPQTEMPAFAGVMSDAEIWRVVAYLREQASATVPQPAFVADPHGRIVTTPHDAFRVEVVARDLETPWGLAFLPDGRLLVTERPGRLRVVQDGTLLPPVASTPEVWHRQDAGLLDVEVHPRYAETGWIYLAYAKPGPGETSMTAVVRGRLDANLRWVDQQAIFEPSPTLYGKDNSHYGSRLTFDREGHLYYSIGDRGLVAAAQDLSSPLGKIHRVHDDGRIPSDNPFAGGDDAQGSIWSLGHRNPQGLAWHPETGALWETEHGPQGGDEVNVITRGANYGWGLVTSGVQPGIERRSAPGLVSPVTYYTPAIAPSGITFVTSSRYPAWRHQLLLGGLRGQQLRRLALSGETIQEQAVVFAEFGRVRDVVEGPDGYLYVAVQQPGRSLPDSTPGLVLRLVPR